MKNCTFIILFVLLVNRIVAQTPELVINISNPGDIVFYNNDLFVAREDRISKINVDEINPTTNDLFIGTTPSDLLIGNNYMYVADSNLGKVYSVDISNASYAATDIIVNSSPFSLAVDGNELYIQDNYFPEKIFKQNLSTITNATSIEFTEIFINNMIYETYGMIGHNNELYFGQTDPDLIFIRISKISTTISPAITMETIVTDNFNSIPRKFAIKDNYLYIAQYDKIVKIDITATTPTLYDVITNEVNNPQGLAIDGCNLYISDYGNNRITKLNICTLSSYENEIKLIRLYPIPSKDKITVTGLTGIKKYKIFSTLGLLLSEGTISNNENIDIQNLSKNIYFLKFENENTLKFIKD